MTNFVKISHINIMPGCSRGPSNTLQLKLRKNLTNYRRVLSRLNLTAIKLCACRGSRRMNLRVMLLGHSLMGTDTNFLVHSESGQLNPALGHWCVLLSLLITKIIFIITLLSEPGNGGRVPYFVYLYTHVYWKVSTTNQ